VDKISLGFNAVLILGIFIALVALLSI